jgi:hypothetical protein
LPSGQRRIAYWRSDSADRRTSARVVVLSLLLLVTLPHLNLHEITIRRCTTAVSRSNRRSTRSDMGRDLDGGGKGSMDEPCNVRCLAYFFYSDQQHTFQYAWS